MSLHMVQVACILCLDPVLDIVYNIEYEIFTFSVMIHPVKHPLDSY